MKHFYIFFSMEGKQIYGVIFHKKNAIFKLKSHLSAVLQPQPANKAENKL